MSFSPTDVYLIGFAWAVHNHGVPTTAVLRLVSRARHLARSLLQREFVVLALPATAEAPSSRNGRDMEEG